MARKPKAPKQVETRRYKERRANIPRAAFTRPPGLHPASSWFDRKTVFGEAGS